MGIETVTAIYRGAGLNNPANNLIYVPLPTGTLTGVRVKMESNSDGAAAFNLTKNGTELLTTELTVPDGDNEKDSGTLAIVVTNDDLFGINLNGPMPDALPGPPYSFYFTIDDGIAAQTLTSLGLLRSYLASTVTYNNTASLADTALSVTVASGGIYDIELMVHSTAAAKGLLLDFGGTATVTNFIGQWLATKTSTAAWKDIAIAEKVTAAGTDFNGSALDAETDAFYTFKGTIEVNAGGTFLLRGAQNVADVSNTTILKGSTLQLTKLN